MRWRSAASSGLVSLTLLVAAAPADAATTQLGAVGFVNAGLAPDTNPPFFVGVQAAEVVPGSFAVRSYAVPAGYGVLTQWSHSGGTVGGKVGLGVMRRYGAPYKWNGAAREVRTITPNVVNRFNTRIPVQPGDRLLLADEMPPGVKMQITISTPTQLGNQVDELTDYYPNDPQPLVQAWNGYLMNIAARVETDGDGDGYGDDTQDACPTRADLQTACPGSGPGAGPGGGGGGGGKDEEKPDVGRPTLSATVFRAASSGRAIAAGGRTTPVGTRVTFSASEAGSVRFRVQRRAAGRKVGRKCKAPTRRNRKRKKCVRYVTARGSFTVNATPGTNTFRFRGRIGGRKLRPARYRLTGKATDRAGNVSSVPARAFRIVR